MSIVELKNVSRVYRNGDHEQRALDHVDLSLEEGKFIVILGPSGAGKSTLLNMLGGLDSPTEGTIVVGGKDISTLTPNELAEYRASSVGFVFQSYNLIPTLTVIENVALVKEIAPNPLSSHDMLKAVGLADHIHQFPSELSGGEQQRVSIARALAKNPKLLLCDEPTGALDYQTGKAILKLLQALSTEKGMTVVIITHNSALTAMADRVIRVKNGRITSNIVNQNPVNVDTIEW
jgi:putative ABC transport system ATP-binding protein